MALIEFVANKGCTITVTVRDPYDDYDVLQSGVAATEVASTVYRATVTPTTGVVKVDGLVGSNVLVTGYANLSVPGDNGYCEVFDTLQDAVDAGRIEEIHLKTQLIGTGVIGQGAPVASDGSIDEIIIGDDYLASNGRSFVWTFDAITGATASGSTARFAGSFSNQGWSVTGTVTDLTGGRWKISFDLPSARTINLRAGLYAWSAEVITNGGSRVTTIRSGNSTSLVRKYT